MKANFILYLICDTGSKPAKVIHLTSDWTKANNWLELLQDQGKDVTIIQIDGEHLDMLNCLQPKES